MRIDILTLFPASIDAMMNVSILGRAQERGYITIKTHQIREYTTNKQMQVDDYPYGGGRGAVMQADPLYRCWAHVCEEAGSRGHTIYLSPCGRTFTQSVARELKDRYDHLILVCGHYEGIDQRFIDECVDEELSMGDFVVTGGEIPAMAVTDAMCCRKRNASPRNRTGQGFWNIRSIPVPMSGMAAACRTCCSPATTKMWPSGAKRRATSARCCAVPTSGRSLTKSSSKQRAKKRCSPRRRQKSKPSAQQRRSRQPKHPQNPKEKIGTGKPFRFFMYCIRLVCYAMRFAPT